MNRRTRNMLAVALAAALASPLALAGTQGVGLGQVKSTTGAAARIAAPTPQVPTQALERPLERTVERTTDTLDRASERGQAKAAEAMERTNEIEEVADTATSTELEAQGAAQAAGHSEVALREVWGQLDTDGDGLISADEAGADAALDASFATVDANQDGFLSDAEYRAHAQAQHVVDASAEGAANAATTSMVATRAVWAELDVDGDGRISTTEAAADASFNTDFATLDMDDDGFVTQSEYRLEARGDTGAIGAVEGAANAAAHSSVAVRSVWAELDADADGRISSTEAAVQADFEGSFETMDSDGDGFVTEAEYRTHAKGELKPVDD